MRNYKAEDVESFIAGSSEAARPHLEELRKIITSTVPDAEEKISWGIPFYWYHGALAGISPFKNHVGFGFAFTLENKDREILEKIGYKTGSKTVQIRLDQKVPATEIQQILKTQALRNAQGKPFDHTQGQQCKPKKRDN